MSFVIFFCGEVASLKSTLSKEVSRGLRCSYLATHTYGEVIGKGNLSSLTKRNLRYAKLFADFDALLSKDKNVVIDGTFIRRTWRAKLFKICKKHGVKQLIRIHCTCKNKKVQEARLCKRKSLLNSPEHHCHKIADALHDKKLSQKFSYEELKLIDSCLWFDSVKRRIKDVSGYLSSEQKGEIKEAVRRLASDKEYLRGFL